VHPLAGPNQSPFGKFGKTTHWYFTLCCRFHPLYILSCPYVGLQIVNIVPSMNPMQTGSGLPHLWSTSANGRRSCSYTSKCTACPACTYTWSRTTSYISDIAGGDRPNTFASYQLHSHPASRRRRSKKASSPAEHLPLANCNVSRIPSNPSNSPTASLSNRNYACNSSSVKGSALLLRLAGTTCGLHHSRSFCKRASHSLTRQLSLVVNA